MPLLLLIPVIGASLWAGAAVSGAGQSAANFVTNTTPQNSGFTLPNCVIPVGLAGVVLLLVYKEGAKILKI
jgi:hypothetical protein